MGVPARRLPGLRTRGPFERARVSRIGVRSRAFFFLVLASQFVGGAAAVGLPSWIETRSDMGGEVELDCPGAHAGLPLACDVSALNKSVRVEQDTFVIDSGSERWLVRLVTAHGVRLPLLGEGLCDPRCWGNVPEGAPLPRLSYLVEPSRVAYAKPHSEFPYRGNATLLLERVVFNESRALVPVLNVSAPAAVALGANGEARLPISIRYEAPSAPQDTIAVLVSARTTANQHPLDVQVEGDPLIFMRLLANETVATASATLVVRSHSAVAPGWLGNISFDAVAAPSLWRFAANASTVASIIAPTRVAIEVRHANRDLVLSSGEASLILWVQNRGNVPVNLTGRLITGPDGVTAEFTTPRVLPAPRFPSDNLAGSAVQFVIRAPEPPRRGNVTLVVDGAGPDDVNVESMRLVLPFVGEEPRKKARVMPTIAPAGEEDPPATVPDVEAFATLFVVTAAAFAWRRRVTRR